MGGGGGFVGGDGGQGKVAKEQIDKEKRKALDAKKERRNAAPPSTRKESPHLVTPEAS
jgi:hypothetical protein